jgi:hypothetical protein
MYQEAPQQMELEQACTCLIECHYEILLPHECFPVGGNFFIFVMTVR